MLVITDFQYYLSGSSGDFFILRHQVQINAVIAAIALLITIIITLRHIKSHALEKREWISLLLYLVAPFIMIAPEYLLEGIWLTWLGGSITMFLIYVNIHVALRIKVQEQEIEMTESRVAIMLSQIQPHFLYNTLTAIEYLCNKDGAAEAGKVARDFSKYLRGNIDSLTRKLPVPFNSELEHTKLYLSIEQLQYEDRLRVEYDIKADGFSLLPLTLQPLAENAVKHGVSKRDGGGAVKISTEETDSCFRVVVSDDGVGFSAARQSEDGRSHIGIDNVRRRLESVLGGGLSIESEPGAGTTAIITIPKKESRSQTAGARIARP